MSATVPQTLPFPVLPVNAALARTLLLLAIVSVISIRFLVLMLRIVFAEVTLVEGRALATCTTSLMETSENALHVSPLARLVMRN